MVGASSASLCLEKRDMVETTRFTHIASKTMQTAKGGPILHVWGKNVSQFGNEGSRKKKVWLRVN